MNLGVVALQLKHQVWDSIVLLLSLDIIRGVSQDMIMKCDTTVQHVNCDAEDNQICIMCSAVVMWFSLIASLAAEFFVKDQ